MSPLIELVEKKSFFNKYGFTLIEILIVISIIAILASTIIPNFIGFDAEARIISTKSNLESIRTRINLFRAKEGKYPSSLEDLITTYYSDMGIKKPYFKKIPLEMISNVKGNNEFIDINSSENISAKGGWLYFKDTADVRVNVSGSLGNKWGNYSEEEPFEW